MPTTVGVRELKNQTSCIIRAVREDLSEYVVTLRGNDALYVALADQLGDTLVTLDRQQLERGAAVVMVRAP